MILYHYSVDSYRDGNKLINDYKNLYQHAEPFIFALRHNMETFMGTYYAAMYMSREMVELKLRKYELYRKDAVEGIFEFVRETEFADMPSRLQCVFYCKSKEEAIAYMADDCFKDNLFTKDQVKLLEVDVEDSSVKEYDQMFYNHAMEEIEQNNFDAVFADARKYYSLERSETPLIEIISDGRNQIKAELSY